ncbi:NAD(P)-dependent oxidoreductase [Rhodococcus sp. 06-156-3C]|uniref:SDR family NAD(P)-dependent oxidoreductase n=1 Tax=Nocardiaceae TaxID=85025 RepID=UPI00052306B0|nr:MULTISPECIES: SDR family oxidoreductase [Rhodococcus]OZD13070.1 NAD(P)-dependent oxidoreductase [Rhodococcus sp. 06-156-4a]OZD17939.1 NAD(P)-dependent oxidoreductase [Rhodococcus sp. 06-156-3C]OZD20663.1 NAD(P)-dependent oxidoreductase [Rhodococcus sp. 06-156-4C]OZD30619.1 NAD(P)-dependent oxidoreductase [Rhodococcus sp. 06-156-3b]OZD32609.1 NAD(P)-dependent oxidoreductase [Rhodococcus sp. 06-156-3]
MSRLEGKIAFVTGAGGGIGRAICEQFLAEGASVAATDIDLAAAQESIATAAEGKAIALKCDAGDSDDVRERIADTVRAFGSLNVLCNVAGGSSNRDARVTEAPEEEFWRVIRLDLFGPFVSCKHGLPHLIAAGGGSVINMTSMGALMALPDRDCYTSAKGGVAALTRSMAAGYGEHGIRVNAIAPGMTLTARVQGRAREPKVQALSDRHLLGPATPLDIAYMAVYLASDESRVTTGQVISVDSGVTIH